MRMSGLCKVEMSAFMVGRGPMETERIALSQRERDRLRVLQDVQRGHLMQVAAAQRIKITDRQVRQLLLRLREQGDRAVIHGLRGRPSPASSLLASSRRFWRGCASGMLILDPRWPPNSYRSRFRRGWAAGELAQR